MGCIVKRRILPTLEQYSQVYQFRTKRSFTPAQRLKCLVQIGLALALLLCT